MPLAGYRVENCTGTGIAGSPRGPRGTRGYGNKVHGLTAGMGSTTGGDTAGTVCVHRYASAHTFYCAFTVHFTIRTIIFPCWASGRTLEDERNMLSAESVDRLLFLHGL